MAKILICTNHFYPETFRVNDVAFHLASKGHDVTVLTAIPDYPKGHYHEGYGIFRRRHEKIRGVEVIRGFIIPRGEGGSLRLALNYFSFLVSSVIISIYLAIRHHYDEIFVHETSPVMIGIPGVIVKKMRRVPLHFWVLDLWPESMQAAGGVNNKMVLGFFERLTKWIYKNSDKILISSEGFRDSICSKGPFEDKILYFPNWADREIVDALHFTLPCLPKGFVVMFAGNVGEAQDFEHIMEAAFLLRQHKNIHLVVVGDGRKLSWVRKYIEEHHLQNTVHLAGRHPVESMSAFFNAANLMLISLKDESIFNLTVPAKLQAYMSAAKPVIAMMNGEGPRIIAEAHCGLSVAAGDAKALASAIVSMSEMKDEELIQMGLKGKSYLQENFCMDKCMETLESILDGSL